MKYTLEGGKVVTIPDKELEKSMTALELTRDEAIQLWLEDHDYEINEEQAKLDAKAKTVKIQHNAKSMDARKQARPHITKVSDEKKELFSNISSLLFEKYGENVEIVKENKLILIKLADNKVFKVDIIEQRPKKQ